MSCQLPARAAVAWSFAMSASFVLSLYLVPSRWRRLHRNAPAAIYARFVAASTSTAASVAVFVVVTRRGDCFGGLAKALGVDGGLVASLKAAASAVALAAVLYTGTLAASALVIANEALDWRDKGGSLGASASSTIGQTLDRLMTYPSAQTLRNLVIGPLTEEIVFRACVVPMLLEAGFSLPRAIFVSPLFFGVAHLHHLKRYICDERMPVVAACIQTLVQFAYTTLFGMYTAFIFTRTGHISAAVACHAYCNYMGLPDISFAWPPDPAQLRWLAKRDRIALVVLHERRYWIFLAYVLGIVLFATRLFPWTSPTFFASPFWPPSLSDA
mmetsp:Transcript_13634/g.43062  ORF Transcript_13634/g.43062 Transcript_13634/m.43062 type:complete len:328 (+) Transcript_13634:45-1028(+)